MPSHVQFSSRIKSILNKPLKIWIFEERMHPPLGWGGGGGGGGGVHFWLGLQLLAVVGAAFLYLFFGNFCQKSAGVAEIIYFRVDQLSKSAKCGIIVDDMLIAIESLIECTNKLCRKSHTLCLDLCVSSIVTKSLVNM